MEVAKPQAFVLSLNKFLEKIHTTKYTTALSYYHCILWQKRESMLVERRHSWIILSDLEMLVSGIFMDGYLNSSPIINLSTNKILQLMIATYSLAAWPFCMRLSRVLPSSLIMSGQTPAATPLCFIKFWQLMKSAPQYPHIYNEYIVQLLKRESPSSWFWTLED